MTSYTKPDTRVQASRCSSLLVLLTAGARLWLLPRATPRTSPRGRVLRTLHPDGKWVRVRDPVVADADMDALPLVGRVQAAVLDLAPDPALEVAVVLVLRWMGTDLEGHVSCAAACRRESLSQTRLPAWRGLCSQGR